MEEQVNRISDLEGLNSELDEVLSGLRGREEGYSSRIAALEASLARALAEGAASSAALKETRAALAAESARAATLALERDNLAARLESASGLLAEEKNRSAEKDLFVSSARSAVKDKEAEVEKTWRVMEELKAELALGRSSAKEREAQLAKISKIRDGLELQVEQAAREGTRSEEGFLLKIELIKKELREQSKRCEELERSLAAAGGRLEEALEDAGHKGELLAAAELKCAELAKEAVSLKKTGGEAAAERGRETTARFKARISELEARLAEDSTGSLEKFRALQDELAASGSALRSAQEDREAVKARESALLKELQEAQEKWKLSAAQLHNAVSKLRAAENDNEVNEGRLKTLEAECARLRTALTKAEKAASSLLSSGTEAQDGEAGRLLAAMQEQGEKYAALSRERDALLLSRQKLSSESAAAQTEAAALREKILKAGDQAAALLSAKEKDLSELAARLEELSGKFALKLREEAAAAAGYSPEFEELVAGVAHQVANSISIIRSHAEFCAEAPAAEGAKESLAIIVRNIVVLQKKIEAIINFSRPLLLQRSRERLADILEFVIKGLRSRGSLDGLKVTFRESGTNGPVQVDRTRLADAFENLLLNAAEASAPGSEIFVTLARAGGRQRVEVRDTGPGIEEKNLRAVFQPFFTTRPGKAGLGLALARGVAKAHGGTLELSSSAGKGTSAVLELPEN